MESSSQFFQFFSNAFNIAPQNEKDKESGQNLLSSELHCQEQEQACATDQDNNEFSPELKMTTRSNTEQPLLSNFSPKLKLKTLFIFYCSFGTRLNLTHLSLQKFQKLLEDANIIDENLNPHQLNIIVLQTTHSRVNSIDFPVFLDLLPKISAFKFKQIDNTIAAFEALLEHHLFPLFQCVIEQTDLGKELQILNQPLEETTIKIMVYLAPQFTKLYYIYFKQELGGGCQKSDLILRSLKALSKFLQEFEICPPLISKSAMNVIYFNILEIEQNSCQLISQKSVTKALQQQNISNGIMFTFNRFLTFIVRASVIAFNSFNEIKSIQNEDLIDEQSQPHKLLFLLNRMQISSGFQMVEKRTDRPHQQRLTFQINNQKLDSLLGTSQSQQSMIRQSQIQEQQSPSMSSFNQFGFFLQSQQQTNQSIHMKQQLFLNPSSITLQNSRSQQQFFMDENLSSIPQDVPIPSNIMNPQLCVILDFHQSSLQIFQSNYEQLLKIFQYYCSLGEPLNITKLKSFKLAKLLKQSGLLQSNQAELQQQKEESESLLSLTDMDLIFSKLTGTKLQQLIQDSSHQPKWDKNIRSPMLGERRHLVQVDSQQNSKNCMGKLEFEQFLKALELIAIKLFPDSPLSDSLPLILNKYILAQDLQNPEQVKERAAGTYHIQLLMSLLNDHDVVTLLNEVHKPIELIYINYCNHKQLMNFDSFITFSKDFDLFPDIISKSKLLRIFYALSSIYQSQNQELSMQQSSILKSNYGLSIDSVCLKDQFNTAAHQNNFIDSHLFVESIALCALEVPYFEPQPSNVEKIIYLLQRLNSSNKYQSIQKQLGYKTKNSFKLNLLTSVIKKYTSMLSMTNFYEEEPETFEDFIRQTKFDK